MPIPLLMPALSPTMEEGKLAKWLVKEGDKISIGTVIAEIETDKAVMEMEAVDEGVIGKLQISDGAENVKVNSVIAYLFEEGENIADFNPADNADNPVAASNDTKVENNDNDHVASVSENNDVVGGVDVSSLQCETEEKQYEKYNKVAVRDALRDAIAEEMRLDENIFLMGEEVAQYQGAYKVSRELLQEFGEKRVIDTPITEYGFAGVGVGAAFAGLRPIVEFMTWNFAMQAIDHIVNSAAKTRYMSGGQMSCPIVFRGPNAAASRVAAQHSQDYTAWYASVPGLIVISPYCSADAKGLLKSAIRNPNPVVFLEHELLYGEVFDVPEDDDYIVPIGKARIRKTGNDLTIIAASRSVKFAMEAALRLEQENNITAEVIDLRTIRPLDIDTIVNSVKKTNRVVTIEESWPFFGIGSEISYQIMHHCFDHLDAPLERVTQEDVPLPYADNLEKLSLPNGEKAYKACLKALYLD